MKEICIYGIFFLTFTLEGSDIQWTLEINGIENIWIS